MKRRPEDRRGLVRSVRANPLSRLGAIFALLTYVLVGIAPLWVPALERSGIEVCTADGIRIISADLSTAGSTSDTRKGKLDCPLCAIQGAFLLPPAEGVLGYSTGDGRASIAILSHRIVAGLFAGFDHFSRAPPALS